MAFGKEVTIRPVDTDRYGRTVAEVILPDGTSLNREMVERGFAWYSRQYNPVDVVLNREEVCARKSPLGRWGRPNPVPPRDWRQGKGLPVTAEAIEYRNSHVYHAPHCADVARMKDPSKAEFKSAAEAEAAGYRKAGGCE